jgi:hypothetical protein
MKFIQTKEAVSNSLRITNTPLILATQEAVIRRLWFEASLEQIVCRPYLKNTHQKMGW